MSATNQRFGCVCGWSGPWENTIMDHGKATCPRCWRTRQAIREVIPVAPCPMCGSIRNVRVAGINPPFFYCVDCHMAFDDDPEEGGDHATGNPARRMEREEG